MYSIYSGANVIHHPFSDAKFDPQSESAVLDEEINTHGTLNLTVNNPRGLGLRSPIKVFDDDGLVWRGRVLDIQGGLTVGRMTVLCEGALAALCDTTIPPFSFTGTRADLFRAIVNYHNSLLPQSDERRFAVGNVDGTDSIHRSSDTAMSAWEAIKSRLLEKPGGYVYLSGANLDVINYTDDFDGASNQTIHFGENIVDLMRTDSAAGIVTMLDAYGARVEEPAGEPTGSGFQTWNGDRLHLSGYVSWTPAINKWGVVYGTSTFDDAKTLSELEDAAGAWVVDNYRQHVESLEVTATDLSEIDPTIDKLKVGLYVRTLCEPLSLDLLMLCVRKSTNLLDPSQTMVSIGRAPVTMSGIIGGNAK